MIRRSAPVYLNTLGIVPQKDWKSAFEAGRWDYDGEPADRLQAKLEQIFALERVSDRARNNPDALGLDIFLTEIRTGEFQSLTFSSLVLPIAWRPRIVLKARLFRLVSGETLEKFVSKQSIDWFEFGVRSLNAFGIFRDRPIYNRDEMDELVEQASVSLLESILESPKNRL
ncbi:MAG: hypothetical protein AAGJ87_08655 [Pseudomonadota bacterium]